MSILDRGRHSVVVTPMTQVRNSVNTLDWVAGAPVTVSGVMVQALTTEESDNLGLQTVTSYRVIGRGPWPGGPYSRVAWNGRTFDQVGEARVYTNGRRTAHVDVVITARGAEVK